MGIFIGRQEALAALISDLCGPSARTIADIHGLGGMGKTTLKAEVLLRLQDAGARIPFCHADENSPHGDLAEFLGALAGSLHQPWEGPEPGFPRLTRHRDRLRDLAGRLGRETNAEMLDRGLQVALSGQAGFTFQHASADWTLTDQYDYVTAVSTWTRDHEDRELLLDPLAVLTRDFLADLADFFFPGVPGFGGLLSGPRQLPGAPLRLLLVVDSYEALDAGVQEWLLVHLLPGLERHRFEGRPIAAWLDLRLLLCGRQALRDADPMRRWDVLASSIREIDLDRFESAEVTAYLEARGLPADRAGDALAQTQGLPYLLALWCDSAGKDRTRAVERAARRIFWWKTPQQIRWLKAAAFLDTVDRDALAIALSDGSQEPAYAWLAANSELCRSDGAALTVHPIVKGLVCEALEQESATEAAELSRRAQLAIRVGRLRRQQDPETFERLLALAPLRWFDPGILRELWPAEAGELVALAGSLAGSSLVVTGPAPGTWALQDSLRQDATSYLKLAQAPRYHDAVALVLALDHRRQQTEAATREQATDRAQSLARDATVARKRAMAIDARFLALQAQERVTSEAQRRAEGAAVGLAGLPARTPWWAAAATAAFGAVAALSAQALLAEPARLWALGVTVAMATLAFVLTLRALALPRSPSPADHASVRHDIDATSSRLADIQAELSQLLVEASEAAREADALEAQAADTETAASRPFMPLL